MRGQLEFGLEQPTNTAEIKKNVIKTLYDTFFAFYQGMF